MKRNPLTKVLLLALGMLAFGCQDDGYKYVLIQTEYGDMKVKLYNSTPMHRDSFLQLVEEGYYEDLLFHRVVKGFVIQGGDPDSRNAEPGKQLGYGGPGHKVDPEIGAPHLAGALAMAQDGNPQKQSSGSQFYIVQGQPVTDEALDRIEKIKGIKYSPEQRQAYKVIGGTPMLDNDYTVFGEVVEGENAIGAIANQQVDRLNRPEEDIKMNLKVVRK